MPGSDSSIRMSPVHSMVCWRAVSSRGFRRGENGMKMGGRVSGPTGWCVTCAKDFSLPIPTAAASASGDKAGVPLG